MSCRSLVSLIFLCLLNTPLVECRFLDNNGYNFRPSTIVNDVFYGRKVPDFCLDYFNSSSAKLKIANINRGAVQKALEREEEAEENMQELRDSIENHAQQQYSNHICDAREFAPTVLSSRHEMNCVEICRHCVPGSIPICFQRNPQYTGLAQVCLCTYDLMDPVKKAAFSLRHEKRIFNRRI